jgi:hypothetical protein
MNARVTPTSTSVADTIERDLRAALRGQLILPDDADYDDARTVWNRLHDRYPTAIVRCHENRDIQAAVRFARAQGHEIAIRGGGHSMPGYSTGDGVLVIDVSPMKNSRLNPETHTLRAEAGLRLGEFLRAIVPFGLGVTTGTFSDTGLAGLTLGGGMGWLMGKYGLTIDNLLAVELVTANGDLLHTSADEHPDLFWALRGAGANFGIVSAFTFQLHPVQLVLGGLLIYPMERAGEVLRFYRDFTSESPDDLTTYAALMTTPDGHPAIALGLCYTGDLAEGARAIAPLRHFGPPSADLVHPMDLYELNTMLDAAAPRGRNYYEKASALPALSDEAIAALVAGGENRTSPFSSVFIQHMHGAATRVDADATAFGARDETYVVAAIAGWDSGETVAHVGWARALCRALMPSARAGVYVNFLGDEGQERVRAAYGSGYDRLVAIKNRYDPDNVFHRNQNIPPGSRNQQKTTRSETKVRQ